MDGGLGLENQCPRDGIGFGSSIEERWQGAVEGVAECVSGGIGGDSKMSGIDSCGYDGGAVYGEVDRPGFEERERSVESGLGFCSGCDEDRKEMAGTVVESEVKSKEDEISASLSVLKDEKDLESAVEVEVQVRDEEVVHQDGLHNVLDPTDECCDLVESRCAVKPDIVSVDDSQGHGMKMLSSSEIHGLCEGDGTRKVSENHATAEVQTADESVLEVRNVKNCSSSVSGDGISAGSTQKQLAGLDENGTGSSSVSSKQEMNVKERPSVINGKGAKKVSGMNGNGDFGLKKCSGSKRTYSRKELEALQYANVEEQQGTWNRICLGMGDAVAQQLDTMSSSRPQNHGRRNDHRQNFENRRQEHRESGSHIVGHNFEGAISYKVNSGDLKDNFKKLNLLYLACEDQAGGVHEDWAPTVCDEDEDDEGSDDEYDSIRRRAFVVEGDPDFESGPPEDGLEYLRRVRWEAKYIPKVKVAKVDICKISNEQTVYMPKIPDIPKCSEHLMPCKQWEDAFLADFADLRLTISQLESSYQQDTSYQHALSIIEIRSCPNEPVLSFILRMDYVSRASMLKNWIRSVECMSTLSRKDSVWLYSLCASVDIPLDADMASYMRALLRKCASLLAEKTEVDDEVVMLNILATISGRYFKQLDH